MAIPADLQTPAAILKQETLPAHQRTEKALVGRIKAISGPEDYCSLLACLYGYFSPIEQAIASAMAEIFPDHALRRKSNRLREDVHVLNPDFIFRTDNPHVANPSAATSLGYAYVMEGSVLGGAVIKKMISGRFPAIPEKAFGFFSGYGEENRSMWNAFLEVLNERLASPDSLAAGLQAAEACFTGMEHWINSWFSQDNQE